MYRNGRKQPGDGSDGSAPSVSWLFAQAILGRPIPKIINPETKARAEREELERLARFSSRHAEQLRRLQADEKAARRNCEILEWAARISTDAEKRLRSVVRQETEEREAWQRAEQYAERLREGSWDPSKHPRGAFPQNRGWWSPTAGSGSAAPAAHQSTPFSTAAFRKGPTPVRLAAGGAGTWPVGGPTTSLLPKVGSGAVAGAGAAAGVTLGGLLAGLKNFSMGAYSAHVPGTQAMPRAWVYELEKRVRAGKLSHDDAVGIFHTALLGAEAQNFKPTGNTMAAVHKSITDFLGQAEAVYFARKKKKAVPARAAMPGAYQQSGGRVFPTERNSGLSGRARREEQERFFERGLSQGKVPEELRGQAHEAGAGRVGHKGQPDALEDPDVEAALQRAIRKTNK